MRPCSGECGYEIGPGVVACIGCWKRVPLELKKPLWAARKEDDIAARVVAVRDIFEWLHANPVPAPKRSSKK